MIDLLICCLVRLPFLTADTRLHSGDWEAGASEGRTGPSIYHPTNSTVRQRRGRIGPPSQAVSN